MKRNILLALFASCVAASAARPPAAAPAAAPAVDTNPLASLPAMKVDPYKLENRSSFTLPIITRTPMWPIGWVRPAGELPQVSVHVASTGSSGFQIQPHHLIVTSILTLSGEPLATINGRAFGEGEVLPIYVGEKPVKVTVKAIRDGVVIVEQNGRQIVVPIQRKGVLEKAPSDLQQPQAEGFKIKILDK
jgi:hypothetical protein